MTPLQLVLSRISNPANANDNGQATKNQAVVRRFTARYPLNNSLFSHLSKAISSALNNRERLVLEKQT